MRRPALWAACLAGREPAESLSTRDREALVATLHARGWSDLDIAEHTCMSLYTSVRIRSRLGLPANHQAVRGAA